jgi:hypothetical protein
MDTTSINITTKAHYGDPLTTIRSHCGIPIIIPPKSNSQSSVFQKDVDRECKMKMISSK